ncbi:MAG: sortase [Streptococcaceae bacterium]|jgi:hypothetical protein|nr:sortase [Streptococcaceae bacterium]
MKHKLLKILLPILFVLGLIVFASLFYETPNAQTTSKETKTQASSTPPASSLQTPQTPAVDENTASSEPVSEVVPESLTNALIIKGQTYHYQDGGQGSGQAIIDAAPNSNISTWGGAGVQSVNDGLSTHFIGHNPGVFGVLFSLSAGDVITVYDNTGAKRDYTVSQVDRVDDYANSLSGGGNYWDRMVGSGGGERLVFQTCINDDTNLVVFAN